MGKCDNCGRTVATIFKEKNNFGKEIKLCARCKEASEKGVCWRCGRSVAPQMSVKGMCMECAQLDYYNELQKQESVLAGTGKYSNRGDKWTEEQIDYLLSHGQGNFTPEKFAKSREMQQIWILVKFMLAGITDNKVIEENMNDVYALIDENMSKIIGHRTDLRIAYNKESRQEIKSREIIASHNNVYLLKPPVEQ